MTVRICTVGDIGVVGAVAGRMREEASPWPFHHVAPVLLEGDLVLGNLEIPLSGGATIAPHESRRLETPPDAIPRIAAAGFHVLSLANNHVMDFGVVGLEATLRALRDHGLACVGAGRNLDEAREPVVVERDGLRIGILAYATPSPADATPSAPGAAPLRLELVREDVARLRTRVDHVIVSLHFGMMYLERPSPEDVSRARAVVDAGASFIFGHHPHVLQGAERFGNALIAYSLGEFVFDPRAGNYYARVARDTRRRSLVYRAELTADAVREVDPVPTLADADHCPRPLRGAEAADAIHRFERLSNQVADPDAAHEFWTYAGDRLLEYQLRGIWFEIRHGHVAHLLSRLPRLRGRHLKLVLGYLRTRLRRRRN